MVQLTGVAACEIELTELVPFQDYVISVTSEVVVSSSSQGSDVTARTTTTTFTTLEGGIHTHTHCTNLYRFMHKLIDGPYIL